MRTQILSPTVLFLSHLECSLVLGYAYPAYDCYKTLEGNSLRMEHLRFWCQYWILLAFMTALERVADPTISWLPIWEHGNMLSRLNDPFQGAMHVYDGYLRPFLARHEEDIDRCLLELRARARDATASHLQAAMFLSRAWAVEVVHRVSLLAQQAAEGPNGKAR
ncbi:hypothetical protein QOZ80_6BG0482280 [Eleusine coracana subsp. coracana]|nr:hypothetical protein QOZ80_6BG0482280 [Eleusine coracana subsp. coracana]